MNLVRKVTHIAWKCPLGSTDEGSSTSRNKKKLVSVKPVSYNVLLACCLAKKESENSCFSLRVADTTTVSPIL